MTTNSSPLPDLRDVTLCAVDTINAPLAARALDLSMSQCHFGDAILFTDTPVPTRARIVPIERIRSREVYSTFLVKQLVHHITTPWVLVVQWDGYVLNGARWNSAYLDYDYVGARWPDHHDGADVGNGGFSLRSARLLQALASDRFAVPENPIEDDLICRAWRPALEAEFGIRFATGMIADNFAYEGSHPDWPTFGFHGVFNLWRHVDDSALMDMMREVDIRTFTSRETLFLLVAFCRQHKFSCMKPMYVRYRQHWNEQEFVQALVEKTGAQEETARHFLELCERA
jgi:hypothetical protein